MAPAKVRATNSPQTNLEPGDLVFAKVKGYPFWPARVEAGHPEGEGKKIPVGKVSVFFYGTYEGALVLRKDVVPFEENKEKYGKSKKKTFVIAMKEIEETPEITSNPLNKFVTTETLSTIQTTEESSESHEEDEASDPLVVDRSTTEPSKSSKKKTVSSSGKKKTAAVTGNEKGKKKGSKGLLVKMHFDQKGNLENLTKDSSLEEDEQPPKTEAPKPVTSSSKRKMTPSVSKSSLSKRSKKEIEPEEKKEEDDEMETDSVPVVEFVPVVVEEQEPEPEEQPVEKEPVKKAKKDKSIPSNTEKASKESTSTKEKVKMDKSSKKDKTPEPSSAVKVNGSDISNNNKVMSEAEKLEKLKAKAAEKERQKEELKQRKLEEKRQKRLEELKSQPVTEVTLKDIETEIVESLSVERLDVQRCLNAMKKLDLMTVTQDALTKYPDILKTIKKVKKFKSDETVRLKAENLFNKFKHLFSNGVEEASTVQKASVDEKKSKTTGKQETDLHSPLVSTDNSNDSLKGVPEEKKRNQTGKSNNNNKSQATSTSNKNAIKESSQTPTQTQSMTTKAIQKVKDEKVSHEDSISSHSEQKETDQMTSITNHTEIISEKTETNKPTVSNVHEGRHQRHEEMEGSGTQFHHPEISSSLGSKEKKKESGRHDSEQTVSKTVDPFSLSSVDRKDKEVGRGEAVISGVTPIQETDSSKEFNRETIENPSYGQETQEVS